MGDQIDFSTNSFMTHKPKYKYRSFVEQQFDYVFHGLPYTDIEDPTRKCVKDFIKTVGKKKTGKDVSEYEIEKRARALFQKHDLCWYLPVVDEKKAQELIEDSQQEEYFDIDIDSFDISFEPPEDIRDKLQSLLESSDDSGYSDFPSTKKKSSVKLKEKSISRRKHIKSVEENIISKKKNNQRKCSLMKSNSTRQLRERNCKLTIIPELSPVKKIRLDTMADYLDDQTHPSVINGEGISDCNVATLLNMGNTCFLNCILYALRFAPTFLHNLHHLLTDINFVNGKLKETKTKTSSLGRNGSAVSGSSWRSSSSKDLLSIGNNDIIPKSRDQIVTEKLHALFVTMSNLESKDSPDPYQPEALLQAVRDAKTLFEGNHQQDAHEFFLELLSCLRVTCDKLSQQIDQNPELLKAPESGSTNTINNSKIFGVRTSWKKPPKKAEKHNTLKENGTTVDNYSNGVLADPDKRKIGYNFIAEEFEGVSIHRTVCLECEEVSELKEPFLEIQVPVNSKDEDFGSSNADSSIFGTVCVASEKLCDQNKYFCENCNRYNEASRTVLYEKLPNTMVLHLKRFTTSSSGVEKVNTYVPTPLEIRCFCESCNKVEKSKTTPHKYRLSCVIMHLGTSMASGHYIAYSRAQLQTKDYVDCSRSIPKGYQGKELSVNILKFIKSKALGNSLTETTNGLGPNSKNDVQVCQSIGCCGIRCKLLNLNATRCGDWLEFDDEKVKILSDKEFMDMLNRKHNTTNTPYLLFYSKV
ncbi:ubiquitin specific protease 1 [Rhynchophorus ferrugineus]|uniref:ubiquitin specific protease 1 n=1 Tax=Rhynchophorus ferrugineus TaxID=354439 RepID=UPI003FCD1759